MPRPGSGCGYAHTQRVRASSRVYPRWGNKPLPRMWPRRTPRESNVSSPSSASSFGSRPTGGGARLPGAPGSAPAASSSESDSVSLSPYASIEGSRRRCSRCSRCRRLTNAAPNRTGMTGAHSCGTGTRGGNSEHTVRVTTLPHATCRGVAKRLGAAHAPGTGCALRVCTRCDSQRWRTSRRRPQTGSHTPPAADASPLVPSGAQPRRHRTCRLGA